MKKGCSGRQAEKLPPSALSRTLLKQKTAEVRTERRGLPEPRGGARRDHEGQGPRVASRGGRLTRNVARLTFAKLIF